MEVASLAVGIPPLLTLCFEILDKVQAFRDYSSNSRQLSARFAAAKFRLQDWARAVGIVNGILTEKHHPELDRPRVAAVVDTILECMRDTFDRSYTIDRNLQSHEERSHDVPAGYHAVRRSETGSVRLGKTGRSTKEAIYWALKRKSAFSEQIETFEILVDRLYDIVPPHIISDNQDTSSSQKRPNAVTSESFDTKSIEILQQEIILVVKQLQQDTMRKMLSMIDDWLHPPTIDQEFEKHLENRLHGTCDWIFETHAYGQWEVDRFPESNAKILWISGPAGYGKTVLCAAICRQIQQHIEAPMAYFFSSPHVQAGCSPIDIIRSWISQLCRKDNVVFDLVKDSVMSKFASRIGTQAEIWALFTEIVSKVDMCTLVLDGFDEFSRLDEVRQGFLAQLKKAIAGTRTRLLVTSRPESDIESELSSLNTRTPGVFVSSCHIAPDDIQDDITLYSRKVVAEQLANRAEDQQIALADAMAKKCEGMFLWIKLQKPHLRGTKSLTRLRKSVESMPDGLSQTYGRNWEEIQAFSDDDRRRAVEILRWTCFALRPLTIGELSEALVHDYGTEMACRDDLPDEIDDEYIDGEIKGLCGSLIEIRKGTDASKPTKRTVHLVHVSAKEFLITALPSPLPIPVLVPGAGPSADDHMHLAEVCVRYLICKYTWEHDHAEDEARCGQQFLAYAAINWLPHRDKAVAMSEELRMLTMELFDATNTNYAKWTNNDDFYRTPWTERQVEGGLNSRLYMSARSELPHVMDHLYEGNKLDFNPTSFTCGSALEMAAWKDDSTFQRLLTWGADINTQTGRYGSALGAAIVAGSMHKVRLLLERGADTKIPDWQGRPVLTLACEASKIDMMEILLEFKADPNHKEASNCALFKAVQQQNVDAVKLLMKHGVDVTVKDENKLTALHFAAELASAEIVRLLLEQGASVSALSYEDATPLHMAVFQGHSENLKYLIEYGADMTLVFNEVAPIHLAIWSKKLEAVEVLVQAGVPLEDQWAYGYTPLWTALEQELVDMMDVIIKGGANLMSPIYFGRTPLDWIETLWPDDERLDTWKSHTRMRVRDEDRPWWIKRRIWEVSSSLMGSQPISGEYGLNELGHCFKYLDMLPEAKFAFEQSDLGKGSDGQHVHEIFCNVCDSKIKGIRHVCLFCPYMDICTPCLEKVKTTDHRRRCWKHQFMHIEGVRDPPIDHPDERLKVPQVRDWLEQNLVKFKVDDPSPELVSFEATALPVRAA